MYEQNENMNKEIENYKRNSRAEKYSRNEKFTGGLQKHIGKGR